MAKPKPRPMTARMYTIAEAALALQVSEASVRRAVREGQIPSVRIGMLLRIPRTALDRMLEGEAA